MRLMALVMAMVLTANNAPTSVSFVLDGMGGVMVPVTVGALPFHFLVDTGSTRSVVSKSVARQLALRPVARTEVVSISGASTAEVVALPETCVATQCTDDALAIVAPDNVLAFGASSPDGVLGGDVLSRDFTIDYKHRRFEWDDRPGIQRVGDRLPLSVQDSRAIVSAPQSRGLSLRLVADSGADVLVLFDTELTRSLSTASGLNRFSLQTLGGARRAEPVLIPMLRIGSVTWRDEIAAVVPRPAGYPQSIDGILPLHRFASLSFRRSEAALIVRHR
jgi:predicted aspartyl protease